MTEGFWLAAWALERDLASTDPDEPAGHTIAEGLVGALELQRFLFRHRGWADASWLASFDSVGLFAQVPGIEYERDGSYRARDWPAIEYLRGVATDEPARVAQILHRLRTRNWWVISDALDCAADLPVPDAVPTIAHLLSQWQVAPVQWTHPDVLGRVLNRLSDDPRGNVTVPEAIARLSSRLWSDSTHRYDLEEVLKQARREYVISSSLLADGIELAFMSHLSREESWERYGRRLVDAREGVDDGIDVLAREWLDLIVMEAKALPGAALIRGIRLLSATNSFLGQMGLRSLRVALDSEPNDPLGQSTLESLLTQERIIQSEGVMSELLPLYASHWMCISLQARAEFTERLEDAARSSDELYRMYARDWFRALADYNGPRESILLRQLEEELGPGREEFERPSVSSFFVGAKGPIAPEDISLLSPDDLLPLMRSVPRGRGNGFYDRSVEGLAAQIKTEIERRPIEFLHVLPEIASGVPYPAILYHVIWGLAEAFKDERERTDSARDDVLAFLIAVCRRANDVEFTDENSAAYASHTVLKGSADLVDDLSAWMITTPRTEQLLELLEILLASDDPTRETEDRFGGDNMDPPTLALNTARGRAVRALLSLLSEYWGNSGRDSTDHLHDQLAAIARSHAESEVSPSVLSGFGLYLGQLIVYEGNLWEQIRLFVLPPDEEEKLKWDAVFTTYVVFNKPHRRIARELRDEYTSAMDRLERNDALFLESKSDRLASHILSLSLPNGEGTAEWMTDVPRILGVVPDEDAGWAIRGFAHAAESGEIVLREDWVRAVVQLRLRSLTDGTRSQEASGLVDLIFSSGISPVSIGGEILGLMRVGANVRSADLIGYLERNDAVGSAIGAEILAEAVDRGAFPGFISDPRSLYQLVAVYGDRLPRRAWHIVNRLGAQGMFQLEPIARELAATHEET